LYGGTARNEPLTSATQVAKGIPARPVCCRPGNAEGSRSLSGNDGHAAGISSFAEAPLKVFSSARTRRWDFEILVGASPKLRGWGSSEPIAAAHLGARNTVIVPVSAMYTN
jgi:hypothetical protein